MYQVEASKALLKPKLWARRSARLNVPRNVVMLGMVSMLTDVSSEMVATILPLYLVFTLGASPLALGAIDGTYRGAAALVQVASGFVSDRWRRPRRSPEPATASRRWARWRWSPPATRSAASARSSPSTASARASARRRATR